jgi:hypothetical protein
MADARVDKSWQQKGLKEYSSEAIFGTLRHYGVKSDEAAFRTISGEKFPLGIARTWLSSWKGTGQFSQFPAAAAEELWRRLAGDRLTPGELAEGLHALMAALAQMLEGAPDAPVGKRFAHVDALKPKVPLKSGKIDSDFAEEVVAHLGKGLEALNHLAEALAKDGQAEDAEAFARVEEFLFPERAGVSVAVVRSLSGEKAEALEDLKKLAADPARGGEGRLSAMDAMLALEAFEPGAAAAEALLTEAEASQDFHLAMDAARRMGFALDKLGKKSELRKLEARFEKLDEAHRAAHPGHR